MFRSIKACIFSFTLVSGVFYSNISIASSGDFFDLFRVRKYNEIAGPSHRIFEYKFGKRSEIKKIQVRDNIISLYGGDRVLDKLDNFVQKYRKVFNSDFEFVHENQPRHDYLHNSRNDQVVPHTHFLHKNTKKIDSAYFANIFYILSLAEVYVPESEKDLCFDEFWEFYESQIP